MIDCGKEIKFLDCKYGEVEKEGYYNYHNFDQVEEFDEIISEKTDDAKVELYDLLKGSEEVKRFKELEDYLGIINTKYTFNLPK
jgi:hypothetical protein